ncbi:fimbrial protein [Escherichia coli]|uniref:fimbrial protein n=1 Tax=Escherichia coli TaxID=562 RepID=UPI001644D5F9|nr:fimbrial protein [Escherichia coli]EHY6229543.1 type 1 fimbrial protein [Escherichia coli]MBC3263544.1 type 1 fimbrial protein [Escherichia coli]MBU0064125.1 type 1 fimbrial protein [Escherichia coli]MBU0143549.1 type 1 fimbrial protein [Escherichia coli]MCF1964463.1 type 1 fimbrial protein [Escherichia coli]
MKFNLSNLSAVLLASGMLMSTAVTAAPGDAAQFGGADTDWSTVDYPRLTDMDDNVDSMGGKIRFTGRVVKATCKVATDSKQIEVVLPVVPSNLFTGIDIEAQGASNQTDFNINLTECSNTEDQKIEFRFTGTADSANKTLANEVEGSTDADNSGNAGATGVGIRIYSKGTTNNGLINLNTTAAEGGASTAAYTIPGNATTHDFSAAFTAGYAQNGSTVAPGVVKSTASFVVLYE